MFLRAEKVHKEVDPTFREAVKTQPPTLHVPVAERYGLRVKPNPGARNCGMHVVHEHVIKLDKYKGLSLQDVRNRASSASGCLASGAQVRSAAINGLRHTQCIQVASGSSRFKPASSCASPGPASHWHSPWPGSAV